MSANREKDKHAYQDRLRRLDASRYLESTELLIWAAEARNEVRGTYMPHNIRCSLRVMEKVNPEDSTSLPENSGRPEHR